MWDKIWMPSHLLLADFKMTFADLFEIIFNVLIWLNLLEDAVERRKLTYS
jgi:hypothetical protein